MAAILRKSHQRLASQLSQQFSRSMAAFTSARPGEPTPAISDAHKGPTGVLEVRWRRFALRGAEMQLQGRQRPPGLLQRAVIAHV
jgi:hypothetical protein